MAATVPGLTIRPATPEDAGAMVDLVDLAGHGLPMATWAGMAGPGGDARALGMARARRETGGFSWTHAAMAEIAGQVAGMVMSYRLPETPVPLEGIPALARPLQELENLCPGLVYINAVAVYPDRQGQGIGTALLRHAAASGPCCLIAGDGNGAALSVYARAGFAAVARRPAAGDVLWQPPWRDWVLMRRA